MVRIKMPLRLIEGEKHRNTTFMKRRVVIKKKAMELGKLCDIVTLLVCFGPRGQLETWPEDPCEIRRLIDHYHSLKPDDCIKRRYDLSSFFEAHLKKLQAELQRKRSSWLDVPPAAEFLEDLARSLDSKLATIEERIARLRLKDESKGKEIEVWEAPTTGTVLPLHTIIDARPVQSFECLELPRVKPEEQFREPGLDQDCVAAAASVWGADTRDAQPSLGQPCSLPPPPLDPFMLPMIGDYSFNIDMSYLDDPILSNPFLSMDFPTYPAVGGACTSSLVDVLNPAMTFPLSLCHDSSLTATAAGGIGNLGVPPFHQTSLGAGYNPAMMSNEVSHHNLLYAADQFFQGWHVGHEHSVAETWTTSVFHDLPPNGGSSSDSTQAAAAPSGDHCHSSMFVPSSATHPYS